jgi:hypothetical protein
MDDLILNNNYLIPDLNKIVYRYWIPVLDKNISNEIKIKAIFLLFNSIDKKWKTTNMELSFSNFILNNYFNYFNQDECNHIINVLNKCNCCNYHDKLCSSKQTMPHICLCYSKQLQNIIQYIINI